MKSEQKAPLAAYAAVAAVGLIVVSQSVGHDPLGLGRVDNSLDQRVVRSEPLQPVEPTTPFGTPSRHHHDTAQAAHPTAASSAPPATGASSSSAAPTTTSAASHEATGGPRVGIGHTSVRHPTEAAGASGHPLATSSGKATGTPPSDGSRGDGTASAHSKPGGPPSSFGPGNPESTGGQDDQGDDPQGSGDRGAPPPSPLWWLDPTTIGGLINPAAFSLAHTVPPASVLVSSDDSSSVPSEDPASRDPAGPDQGSDAQQSSASTPTSGTVPASPAEPNSTQPPTAVKHTAIEHATTPAAIKHTAIKQGSPKHKAFGVFGPRSEKSGNSAGRQPQHRAEKHAEKHAGHEQGAGAHGSRHR